MKFLNCEGDALHILLFLLTSLERRRQLQGAVDLRCVRVQKEAKV
jgi:hypothetical protein